jgi:hypothetical protein
VIINTATTLVDGAVPPYNNIKPGDTIFIEGGTRNYLLIKNFLGESGNPIVFMNHDDKVTIDTDHHYGVSIQNCRFIRLTGTGTMADFYGFRIQRVLHGAGIGIGGMSSDVEIDHWSIENVPIGGIYAKTDPDCSFTNTREKFLQYHTVIHDNYIANTGNEGMYIGSTKFFGQVVHCNGTDTLLLPALLSGVKIYGNIIHYPGWDGIQVSSASFDCQVYDNVIMYDSQDEHYGQMSGILLGGGSKCDCYNNYIAYGKGDGIESHGLGGQRIFNNIIVNAGQTFKPGDSSEMKHGIFISDVSVQQDSSFNILFNDIINPKSDGIRFSSTKSRNNLVASNAIINPGNFDYYENGTTSFTGKDSYVMIPNVASEVQMENNFFSRNADSARFAPSGYSLLPGSVLIDAGYFDTMGILFDFYHHERPYGNKPDIGAHEYNPAFLNITEDPGAENSTFRIYPNPVQSRFSLQFKVTVKSKVVFDIYDQKGNHLTRFNFGILPSGEHHRKIDIGNLPADIYPCMLRLGNQCQSGRFIKAGND